LQSIWPAALQAQLPPTHVEPPEQTVPQVPQLPESVIVFAQVPPGHWVGWAESHIVEQLPLLQTIAPMQAFPHDPQLLLSF
jgi:hypothetical protein